MSLSASIDRMRESFEAQFEAAGDNKFLYRRLQRAEPIPVTLEERDRFVRQYIRRIWIVLGGMMVPLAVFWGFVFWWMVSKGNELPDIGMYVGTGVIALVAILLMYWIRGAPARELEGRSPVGRERTTEEMRALYLNKTSYGQLAAAGAFGAFLIFFRAIKNHPSPGWHWFYIILGGGLTLFAAIRAFQKWRFDREHPGDTA